MKDTSLIISGDIEATLRHLYTAIHDAAHSVGVDWLIIGATARNLIYWHAYKIPIKRATRDVDLAIHVEDWEKFEQVTAELVDNHGFTRTARPHRFERSGLPSWVDIVPFGGVAGVDESFNWPGDPDTRFSTLGFKEALATAVNLRTDGDPVLQMKVLHPAVFVMLKCFSWQERRSAGGSKDASDIAFAMTNYHELGNEHRLYDDPKLMEDFQYETVGARLVGRDLQGRASPEAMRALKSLLEAETTLGEESDLAADIDLSRLLPNFEMCQDLLQEFLTGLDDDVAQGAK